MGNGDKSGVETNDDHQARGRRNEPGRGRLLVRMDFNEINKGKQRAALKRWKRDKSTAVSRIRILEQERDKLKTKLKSTQRALQRVQGYKVLVTKTGIGRNQLGKVNCKEH